jgi:hypothetical protein
MPGYRYRLYSRDGDEVGVYESLAWNWKVGDGLQTGDGRRFRIVSILDLDESEDSPGRSKRPSWSSPRAINRHGIGLRTPYATVHLATGQGARR